jgi:hypothetical protein
MEHPEVFFSPVFTSVLQGIQLKYNILQEEPVPEGGLGAVVHISIIFLVFL